MEYKFIDHSKEINNLWEVDLPIFRDHRGSNLEVIDIPIFNQNLPFVFGVKTVSRSFSKRGTIRAMHGDFLNQKSIEIIHGAVKLYVLDYNPKSPTYLNYKHFYLSDQNPKLLILPPQVLNGHSCLSENCIFNYYWSSGYMPVNQQIHVKYNDKRFNFDWEVKNPILSARDQ